ncbi:type II toxin-antitoxin system PemK/MazF family toxin [Heyndrickxia sp. MSNUG]|uniref:type II toxin-antitoxin system PemK/MazF family toxin n=1 Tax=Heyndrickxia sp. MSNUG TaxID=3136677 RepID=UPI003C2C2DA5
MDQATKTQIQKVFTDLEKILDGLKDSSGNDDSVEALGYAEWMLQKAQLRYIDKNKIHTFPLLYKRIYWAFMGLNVGREEDKHRPVVIVKVEKKSPICYVVPLTSQRLGDGYWYHVDLDGFDNTALVEHFRTISKDRIDKPMFKGGKIAEVSTENMKEIHKEIRRMFASPPAERK